MFLHEGIKVRKIGPMVFRFWIKSGWDFDMVANESLEFVKLVNSVNCNELAARVIQFHPALTAVEITVNGEGVIYYRESE